MTSPAARERHVAGRDRVGEPVIDIDVHEMLTSVSELAPYLQEPWRSRITMPDGWQGLPGFPYSYPQVGGLARADAVLAGGAPAGSSYERMREQVLDAYPILGTSVCSARSQSRLSARMRPPGRSTDWVGTNRSCR